MSLKIVILAAGQGTRMKSKLPKVLHQVAGTAMIDHVIAESRMLTEEKPIVVIGHQAERLKEHLADRARTVLQREQLGTGHAVMMAESKFDDDDEVMVLFGDTPLIRYETLRAMTAEKQKGCGAVIMSSIFENPTGYGRIIRDDKGEFLKIQEQKDASGQELAIQEINAGICLFSGSLLRENLKKLRADNAQKEYYLTDVLGHIRRAGHKVSVFQAEPQEVMGINSRQQLADAEKEMRKRINSFHMQNGVTLIDPDNTYIEKNVCIGEDTIIYPNCSLRGESKIGERCVIKEGSTIENSVLAEGVTVKSSTILESTIGKESTIGPYAYLRPKSVLGEKVKIGDFVEVKNAFIGDGSKASHLSYIGDAKVGKHVNIGCGVVFVNYDGSKKSQSIVGDHAFIGSNSNLVAPVTVEDRAFIAAGSTVTLNVPANALCIARCRQVVKENWNQKKDRE